MQTYRSEPSDSASTLLVCDMLCDVTQSRTHKCLHPESDFLTPGLAVTAEAVDKQPVVHQLPVVAVQNVPIFLATVPKVPFRDSNGLKTSRNNCECG